MPLDEPTQAPPNPRARARPGVLLLRGLGAALLLGSYVPLHRMLSPEVTGPAGVQTRAAAEAAWASGLLGTGMVLVVAFLLARGLTGSSIEERAAAVGQRLADVPIVPFLAAVGALALLQSTLIAWSVHGGRPTSVDEMVQLLHARALLAGGIALPLSGPAQAWSVLNGVVTEQGWASVYPPFHVAWLALWLWVGVAWLAGPVATACMVALTAWSADALLENRAVARAGGVLLALCPFVLLLGGTHLSHATAAALLAGVLAGALRARDGGRGWAIVTGAAIGAAVCTRPWTALVLSTVLVTGVWGPALRERGERWIAGRVGALVLGGAPFAVLLFWWNQSLFGSPLRLGYSVAFGPAHGLGFHRDPWGNQYGLVEALAYSGADVVQLGAHLFETPLPALALVGLALLLMRPVRGSHAFLGGGGVFLAWGLAGVAANAFYWHHGVHMGPRLLYETAPAWAVLWVLAAVGLVSPSGTLPPLVRRIALWSAIVALVGGAVLAPGVVRAYASGPPAVTAASMPAVPDSEPALVFVHGSWSARVANRLAAAGMRRDSVETALRRNGICAVDRYARARLAGEEAPASLLLEPRPGTPPHLRARMLSEGNVVRVDPAHPWDAACVREARADRMGSIELEALAWRTTPGTGRLVLVRDLGPGTNDRVMEAYPRRRAWIWMAGDGGASPRLLPYEEGAELLWGGAAGVSEAAAGP